MALFKCIPFLIKRKKNDKDDMVSEDSSKGLKTIQLKLEHAAKSSKTNDLNPTSFNVLVPCDPKSLCKVKVTSHVIPVIPHENEIMETAYEGEDEHEEYSSFKRDFSHLDLQAHVPNSCEKHLQLENIKSIFPKLDKTEISDYFEDKSEKNSEIGMIQSGHVSDPGIENAIFLASPKLKRSCSNLETRGVLKDLPDLLPLSKSQSFEKLQELADRLKEDVGYPDSPGSIKSHRSADRVMLKKHSSAQILPSRSRRLWWKLFLWSHRNLHKPCQAQSNRVLITRVLNQQGGYSSDTVEPRRAIEERKTESPISYKEKSRNNQNYHNQRKIKGDFHGGASGLWPQNQWVAFATTDSPSFDRVDRWVKDLETPVTLQVNCEENDNEGIIVFPSSPDASRSPPRSTFEKTRHFNKNLSEEILHANSVIQSLNSSSTVAHIAGSGLKVIPSFSVFSSLRSINLSNNLIVHITPGSLPKGLHTLNLSKNKIHSIEGLRELTRLRVLDLSYNRILRIGHGLSNCTLIKELYLAGNKISEVEGLHRLLKLTVIDLSFNKITTTKSIGQLVANYNSLLSLNLLGNPIQNTINEDQLRKCISGLLPKLAYLNKQPISLQRAREPVMDNVARAALGNSSLSARRKAGKRVSQGGDVSTSSSVHRSRHGAKSRARYDSPLKISSSKHASSSR